MNLRHLSALYLSASVLALGATQPAFAQQSAQATASSETGIEEVIVTARRKEEKAQSVPIALTNVSSALIAKQDIRTVSDLARDVPGLNVSVSANNLVTNSSTWLRGATGIVAYFDEIPTSYLSSPSLFFDVGSVQVVKGPQGTLFGLSNDAGAIIYGPKKPTDNFEGYVQTTLGNYDRHTFEGVVNVPISDKLLVRIGAQLHDQDGFVHVLNTNSDEYDQHYWVARGTITYRPTDDLENELMVNYLHSQDNGGAYIPFAINPKAPLAFPIPIATLLGIVDPKGPSIASLIAQQQRLGPYTITGTDRANGERTEQLDIVDIATYNINDNLKVKNILGYEETSNLAYNTAHVDIDGLPLPVLNGPTPAASQRPGPNAQYNEELQLQGSALDDKLSFTVGTFNQVLDSRGPYPVVYTNSFGQVTGTSGTTDSRSNAIYAQGTYKLDDYVEGLSFTGGYRYSWDKFYTSTRSYSAAGALTGASSQEANYHSPSYTLSLDYQYTPTTMFYITDSKGYKTGGFNNTGIIGAFQLYGPEHLDNVEAGVKSDFLIGDMKARVNLSGYYGFYENIQVQVTGSYLQQSGLRMLGIPFLNVGDGKIYGYDGEVTVVPVDGVEIGAAFEYNRGGYDAFQGPNAAGNGLTTLEGIEFAYTPHWKFNLHGSYQLPIPADVGDLTLQANYSYTGDRVNGAISPLTQFNVDLPFDNLDMSLDWKNILGQTGVSGRVFVNNLLQNTIASGSLAAYQVIGLIGYAPAVPRMWGVTLRYEFGAAEAPTPAAAAYVPPPPVAAAPSVPHSYLVFFDFNKSDLTSQAVSIVNQAAANAGPAHVTQLTVTGHTDTVGSDAYNMRLSRRRAESVAAQLEKDGIASSEIEIVAKGKRDLLVPTADGVKEPQNRRVQIVYEGGASS
jgi:iron complex outermembrane receptor protein